MDAVIQLTNQCLEFVYFGLKHSGYKDAILKYGLANSCIKVTEKRKLLHNPGPLFMRKAMFNSRNGHVWDDNPHTTLLRQSAVSL